MLKKFAFSFLIAFYLLFTLSIPVAKAQWYDQNFAEWYSQVYSDNTPPNEIFGERYTAAQTQWVIYGLVALTIHTLASHLGIPIKDAVDFIWQTY
jgi:hypothetical protein